MFIVGTDFTQWVKKRSNEIYDDVVRNRQECSEDTREALDLERISRGEKWPLLNRVHNNTAIPGKDEVMIFSMTRTSYSLVIHSSLEI